MIRLSFGPDKLMSPITLVLSHEQCFLFDSWDGINVDRPLASSHRNVLIKSRNLIHRYSCWDREITVGSYIILEFCRFPDLNLLVKLATSEE